jgi:hypothetical protein
MFSALEMAITRRFLGFVREVIACPPISRTLRVLVMRLALPASPADGECAVVFFAPGVRGVAIALCAMNQPSGTPMPKGLLGALKVSSKKFREVTAPQEIHDALMALHSALEAQLRGMPEVALMLTSAFAGAAVDLAATATATACMSLSGNLSLSNYLATFVIERTEPAIERAANVPASDASPLPRPRQLL